MGEAARLLDVHPNTIRRWHSTGKLRCEWTPGGKERRVPESELRRIMGLSENADAVALYGRVRDTVRKMIWLSRSNGWKGNLDPDIATATVSRTLAAVSIRAAGDWVNCLSWLTVAASGPWASPTKTV